MNLLITILILLIPICLYSQVEIADDNFNLQMDKTAHLTTSFGLYFTFYTLYSDSLIPTLYHTIPIPMNSMLSATLVGFSYELYQGTRFSNSDGFSKHDMIYNIIGIGLARFTHEFFLYFREVM